MLLFKKSKLSTILFCLSFSFLMSCKKDEVTVTPPANDNPETTLSKIAFGSCGHQLSYQPILNSVKTYNPDIFIYAGDNVYADTRDMGVFRLAYQNLANKQEFKNLVEAYPIIATWDDHDYGENDAGAEFPFKNRAKDLFFEFWGEPAGSPRRNRDGVYTSYYFGDAAHRVQIIVLDNRYNRSTLNGSVLGYTPSSDPNKTMLGENQWNWLANELLQPAKIRLIVTSTQMCCEHNGWEAWANMPLQIEKMFQTIRDAQAEGVFFLSGDVHYAELSKRAPENLYPMYDLTSSGITNIEPNGAPNQYRIGTTKQISVKHFGSVEINWAANPVAINFKIIDVAGVERLNYPISLSELSFEN
ncbi:MAG: alkaline phosphatase family protein [Bacteroidetes bacterium]|jgi:alkaline phosphatase D|nr:alkaline phosphatase family protein [Bacteroidota bacterium]MBK9354209.1 alkaline phosphatase family protein [Bacteroidota bacterium]MBK9633463.1 alkaline phosphatase family protein [Bacteroidota bacterium]MBL0286216.1 alkaline phosphatase family protein [Bacteroidota bacterium]MBP9135391.1 alkaline phosphatase family protein [Chitinophagales bacterium]